MVEADATGTATGIETVAGVAGATDATDATDAMEDMTLDVLETTILEGVLAGQTARLGTGADRRRSASPGRSASPSTTDLPTRNKTGATQPSIHTKAGDKAGEPGSRRGEGGRSHPADGERDQNHTPEQEPSERARQQTERHYDEPAAEPMDEDDDVEVEDDGMGDMAAMMGFGGFGTTKGKKIAGNNVGAVRKEKKTEYRQYMNRQGGFNRPLSPSR
ncbi:hypothetical protein BD289DRAFT_450185 [Coniella lustricola]|uniref:U4/U6.U5 small nuclear ribonucleoprotein 27kDa protein domain-containing protein n=1 Tax=Coniella lustricola TaxID=2025994 RepID=A0A2T3AJV7_9PEZI|nr:hypothetical protein BD289DRAFT_450185 [Coniella lustricola]